MEILEAFIQWMDEGNVVEIEEGVWTTQDHGYKNRWSRRELCEYFLKLYNE